MLTNGAQAHHRAGSLLVVFAVASSLVPAMAAVPLRPDNIDREGLVDNTPGMMIVNEILANELGSGTDGEFVELVNAGGTAIDIGGWTVLDATGVRHRFVMGTFLVAGGAIVVFGGANAIPPGVDNAVAASTGALGLNNSGDTVQLADVSGAIIDSVTYDCTSLVIIRHPVSGI